MTHDVSTRHEAPRRRRARAVSATGGGSSRLTTRQVKALLAKGSPATPSARPDLARPQSSSRT
jgi:hypothetical protein